MRNFPYEKVTTGIRLLSNEEKIQEIARMLGGVKITELKILRSLG